MSGFRAQLCHIGLWLFGSEHHSFIDWLDIDINSLKIRHFDRSHFTCPRKVVILLFCHSYVIAYAGHLYTFNLLTIPSSFIGIGVNIQRLLYISIFLMDL
ncbi:hypothetical protein DPMN_014831 [Dreissena polymorpha]|uniref:Uncharacterized protein n=1 Tax=Dreissena polymorpha TaxID=45954 RepID=A0A9D4S522_DREPO|nr:hypothetical protein DPMN_014831 [Dreissena polymorpha]